MVCSWKFRTTRSLLRLVFALGVALPIFVPRALSAQTATSAASPDEDRRPLSPAQIALFETPHLRNVARPETLRYTYRRVAPSGFTDAIAVHVNAINSDGTKNLTFDYLTGARRVAFPGV